MSISSWLNKQREVRHEKSIAKHKKNIKVKFGQGEPRIKAKEFFVALGGKEGCLGLLERYMVNVEPSIRDEDEKEEIFHLLAEFGKEVIPAIEAYLNRKDAANVPLTWPLKVLDAVCTPAEAVGVIKRALEKLGTTYTREPERKVALVNQLSEYDDERVVDTLTPFLKDHRDEVRVEALSALTRIEDDSAKESMIALMVDEDCPVRLRAQVAESLQKLGWNVKGFRKKVEEALPDGLGVDRAGKIKGRWVLAPTEGDLDDE
jgi:hypothetical protein